MKKTLTNVNVKKLHAELNEAGIFPFPVYVYENGEAEFNFTDDVDMAAVQTVIDAHDSEPLPPQPTKEEMIEQELANTNALILELTELILGGM